MCSIEDTLKKLNELVGGSGVDREQIIKQVNEQCDKAMGGILFVDEAYALMQGNQDSFGWEALDTLFRQMYDDYGKFVVVISGYAKEMKKFIDSIEGLKSKFSDYIIFEDYNATEK
jgi:ABC-type transporter Mla maintaining outer membrane lipid asymmetry ATPase subunit MlaF